MNNQQLKEGLEKETDSILKFWKENTIDDRNGGFIGRIDGQGNRYYDAPKGVVLNARILWTFSAAYLLSKKNHDLKTASRAFEYLLSYFVDSEAGGVFWSLTADGQPLDTKKQIYAQAFALYGLSEYYAASGNAAAVQLAQDLYKAIERYSFDQKNNGYREALSRNWETIEDLRLSEKDLNLQKTMNTHLHIVEAYANLYKVNPDEILKERIENLLYLFDEYFIDKKSFHLRLFFNDTWNETRDAISYGHDIEAAWLLQQCAEIIESDHWISRYREFAIKIATAATEGLDSDGGLWYEYKLDESRIIREKHWWPQAEALVGFFNSWQLTGESGWLDKTYQCWKFISAHILDSTKGEWYWGVNQYQKPMPEQDKVGLWKCPYHNGRACFEMIKRLS